MLPVKTIEHGSFGYRLIQIMKKLNQGEKLDPQALVEEFNVSLRAIQRGLKERLVFFLQSDRAHRVPMDFLYLPRVATDSDGTRNSELSGGTHE